MEYIPLAVIIIAGIIAYNGKEWLETYWKGKAEVRKEDRLIAEANAREAEAKLALARINGTSPAIHP